VAACILGEAQIVDKTTVLDAQTPPRVQMPNRDGFVPDPRPESFKSAAADSHVRRGSRELQVGPRSNGVSASLVDQYHPGGSTPLRRTASMDAFEALRGLQILVVEDSWLAGVALRRLLQVMGADVIGPVATSADALRLAAERPPDAALVDFNLRDGELAGNLVERLHEQGIHVVVTTGYTNLPATLRPTVAILHKPFNRAELLDSLRPVVTREARA
jgi:CheY-like chemotaxis protein